MAKTIVHRVFVIILVVLALLVCREWSLWYMSKGVAAGDYETVRSDQIEAGHPVTADHDAGTAVLFIWLGGCCFILGVIVGGGYAWSRSVLWPETKTSNSQQAQI
jgi:hypothetical protein